MAPASPVLRNATALYALQVANYVIPLLTLPFLVRTLGAEAYGWLAFAAAVNFYLVLAVDAGMNTHAVRELARLDPLHHPDHAQQAGALVLHVTVLKALQVLACAALLAVLVWAVPSWQAQAGLFALSFLPVLGSLSFPTWLFQGLQVMHHTLVFGLAGRAAVTVGLFVFIKGPQDLLWAAALQGSATLLSGLLALRAIRRMHALRWSAPRWAGVRAVFRQSRALTLSEFTLTALSNSTVLLVGLVHTKEVVGAYAAIEKALRAAASLFMPLVQALQPRMVQGWQQVGAGGAPPSLRRWSLRVVALALAGAAVGVVLAPWGLGLLFGQSMQGYFHWGQVLCLWLPFYVGNAMLGPWWWVASGHHTGYARRVLPGGLLQVGAFVVALLSAGVEAALWAWVVGEAMMTLLLWRGRPGQTPEALR